MRERRQKRPGSRLLLGIALFAGALASMYAGARLAELLLELLGVGSTPIRMGVKVLAIVAALPVGFYLVERLFLRYASRRAAGPDADDP